jgi:hypothetical protein
MYKGSIPAKRLRNNQSWVNPHQPTIAHEPTKMVKQPQKRQIEKPLERPTKARRVKHLDIFDQDGGGKPRLVSPMMATLEQAKAMLSRKRKCKQRKACRQMGAKVYNRKKKRGYRRKARRHGTK